MIPTQRNFIIYLIFLTSLAAPLLAQSKQACLECHNDHSLTMTKGKKEVSLFVDDPTLSRSAHQKLVCVGCHVGFNPEDMPHKEKITPVNCVSCHNKDLTKHAFHRSVISSKGLGYTKDTNCKGCHGTHEVQSTKNDGSKFNRANLIIACGSCHADQTDKFIASAHGNSLKSGSLDAPNCLTCHSSPINRVLPGQDTVQLKIAQVKVCESCHLNKEAVAGKTLLGMKFIASYDKSIHGSALMQGNSKAANCVDCHGSHEMNKSVVASSLVNKMNIKDVCAKCHELIAKEYSESVHAAGVLKGNKDAPACTDCHGEHNILKHNDPASPVAAQNVSKQLCGQCHGSVKLTQKYGLSNDRFQSFSDSYHGLALRAGSLEVANCASCHGAHGIKSDKDSTSTVTKANLVKTCGKCHPGANSRFATGAVHLLPGNTSEPILDLIANLYFWLIVILVGAMFIHNAMDFFKKLRRTAQIRRGEVEEHAFGSEVFERMSLGERLQHAIMAISFIVLVFTGFMLRYPESWWVKAVRDISDNMFEYRSWMHRIAGVAMVCVSLYHVAYISFTARGRQLVKDLLPKVNDLRDAVRMIGYNLGLQKVKPQFARFGYIEKFEYWALAWGTILMAVTGLILWFENSSMGFLTKLGWDISRTIHFYEAILATLAIIVWHFYFVIFNPDIYPMSLAWLTGKVSEKEMAEEHALELEKIRAAKTSNEETDTSKKP